MVKPIDRALLCRLSPPTGPKPQVVTPLRFANPPVDRFSAKTRDAKPKSGWLKSLIIGVSALGISLGTYAIKPRPVQQVGSNEPRAAAGINGFRFAADPNQAVLLDGLTPVQQVQLNRMLRQIQDKALTFFIKHRTASGVVLDRASVAGVVPQSDEQYRASVAATGYGMAAWVLAAEKGMINTDPDQKGWLAHFVHAKTGKPFIHSEISSIDTTLFYLGAFTAAEYFGGTVKDKVYGMFDKVDFTAMRTADDPESKSKAYRLGFHLVPKADGTGYTREFLPYKWDEYSEGILVPFLALGAKYQAKSVWTEGWRRDKKWNEAGKSTFVNLPLFTYFYPHGYLDLKGKIDGNGDNFWKASQDAVAIQQAYCKAHGYPEHMFAITACDGPNGYQIYSAVDGVFRHDDGTIGPPALVASLPFDKKGVYEGLLSLEKMGLLNDPFGITCGFQPATGWKSPDALGIDLGSMILMIDGEQEGLVRRLMSQSPVIKKAMKRAGFHGIPTDAPAP